MVRSCVRSGLSMGLWSALSSVDAFLGRIFLAGITVRGSL